MSANAELSRPTAGVKPSQMATLGALFMATSVAAMVAGEAGAGLIMLCWAAANLIGLPFSVFIAGGVLSCLVAAYLAAALFVRVYRIEKRHTRGESAEDVGWSILRAK